MVCLKRVSNFPYKVEISHAPINNIANEAKSVPREWINEDGNDITQDLLDYLYPLIPFNPRALCRLLFRVKKSR